MWGYAAESDTRWQRLTVSTVDIFIRDLKDAVWEAKGSSTGKGTMVSLYGELRCRHRIDFLPTPRDLALPQALYCCLPT